jgi:hypothetical protein
MNIHDRLRQWSRTRDVRMRKTVSAAATAFFLPLRYYTPAADCEKFTFLGELELLIVLCELPMDSCVSE